MIDVVRFDESRMERQVAHLGQAKFLGDWAIATPRCFAGFIEFDQDIDYPSPIPHDEVQFVLSGSADYIFTSQPDHLEEQTVRVSAGDVLHIHFGTILRWHPIDRPFRIAFAIMPQPPIPYERG